jgi:hypothetical protein
MIKLEYIVICFVLGLWALSYFATNDDEEDDDD